MTMWISLAGKKYEAVTLDSLTLLQAAHAAREVGMSPERMESVLLQQSGLKDDRDDADIMAATAVLVWAARVHAGENHPTVESAQVPMRDIDWINDDPVEEVAEDPTMPTPTPGGSDSGEAVEPVGDEPNSNSPDSTT